MLLPILAKRLAFSLMSAGLTAKLVISTRSGADRPVKVTAPVELNIGLCAADCQQNQGSE